MRPLRFILTLASCIAAFFFLLVVGPWRAKTQENLEAKGTIGTYFNWRTPSSLFPPSAIISLTDDNSTFFLARPAAFGPLLPAKSLSGQLWIGSGFGDDHLGRSGSGGGLEGELGCSDVPGWSDGDYAGTGKSLNDAKTSWAEGKKVEAAKKRRRDVSYDEEEEEVTKQPSHDDGTDDHLHHPLPASGGLKTNGEKKPTHADIQSLQESAEIAGKIVLLSRGGCGFLEKVKWVQRRGGVALIVGDDIRGGPLVTMYARGDTSNVTIPSLFTSHTTAHLLSSLIPSGSSIDGLSPEEAERLGLALGQNTDTKSNKENDASADQPNFTTTTLAAKSTPTIKAPSNYGSSYDADSSEEESSKEVSVGWFGSLFGRNGGRANGDSHRPPSSGNVGWVLQEEFEDEEDLRHRQHGKYGASSTTSTVAPTVTPDSDGFVIGVQDWRDPDLVGQYKEQLQPSTSTSFTSATAKSTKQPSSNGLKGDSITPGSGEYVKAVHEAVNVPNSKKTQATSNSHKPNGSKESKGWFGRLISSTEAEQPYEAVQKQPNAKTGPTAAHPVHDHPHTVDGPEIHEGLWVTLTPTSMSSSPFFDTLLVLVVSPLVTLTVVYALLLLRSRIRRRRWRAPKSVVERLPVRTYQTMPSTTTTSSTTSSISSPITATTPLLPSTARPINARSRPRSRTTPEVPVPASTSLRSEGMATPSLDQIEEKRAAGLAEWRRRYGGKQRECVVCLEEYVDGVSRVMSLPCGHEFHAECMCVLPRLFLSFEIVLLTLFLELHGSLLADEHVRSAKATSYADWEDLRAPHQARHRRHNTTTKRTRTTSKNRRL